MGQLGVISHQVKREKVYICMYFLLHSNIYFLLYMFKNRIYVGEL